jgi:tetratricopeptide (TPR) repeat protein
MRLHSLLLVMVCSWHSVACIWDSDTLFSEKRARPKMAETILESRPAVIDEKSLLTRIAKLKAEPRTNNVAWWNDLAGAYLRLGQAQKAADLLQPVLGQFPNDYGVRANLGTAYHLLGRYAEAERHIARDLELNPDGHFGLERYHLALLQYLARPADYQFRH